jgi:hypothetical protein
MHNPYTFLLDFIPLTENIAAENRVLADIMQRTAMKLLKPECDEQYLETLLQLCCDLGYMDPDVASYLKRHLQTDI